MVLFSTRATVATVGSGTTKFGSSTFCFTFSTFSTGDELYEAYPDDPSLANSLNVLG